MKVDFDTLGDIQKRLERVEAGRAIMPGIPILARLDGRGFHSFTKGLEKPFDSNLVTCMQNASKSVLEAFNADVVYTQSDEITLAWVNPDAEETKVAFGGKFQKLCSLLAAHTSVVFNMEVRYAMGSKYMQKPIFDCRVWQVPNEQMAASNFLWREMDATKNSISMAASAYFSHKQLDGVSTMKRKQMLLEDKGVVWENYPVAYKKGTYYAKRKVEKFLTETELKFIKPEFRPNGPVLRSVVTELDIPPATTILNFERVLFHGEHPIVESRQTQAEDQP